MLAEVLGWIVDLDGVVYRGSRVLPGAARFFETARRLGHAVVVVSNNAAPTREQFRERLRRMGISLDPGQILSSSMAAASYLVRIGVGGPVLAIGEAGLHEALEEAGISYVRAGEADRESPAWTGRFEAVVVGLDRGFTYARMDAACRAILHGARFVGCNPDVTFPDEQGVRPGCGSILAAIATCSGAAPEIVGKPHRPIMDAALEILARQGMHDQSRAIVIGDRLDTDVAAAKALGLRSALVLSGITGKEDVKTASPRPDWVFRDLEELTGALLDEPGLAGSPGLTGPTG